MSRVNKLRNLRNKNAKFSRYCFYIITNIYSDFQICMSVPLTYFRSMIHFYTSRIGQLSICMPVKNQEFSNVFRGYMNETLA